MKMNRILLSLLIASATGPFAFNAMGQEIASDSSLTSPAASSVGRIADAPRSIGDGIPLLNRNVDAPDLRPEAFKSNYVEASMQTQSITDDHWGSISDEAVTYAEQPVSDAGADASCSTCVDMSCGSFSSSQSSRRLSLFNNVDLDGWWAETEALLWWAKTGNSPALAVTGGTGQFPTTLAAGGAGSLGGELAPGMRASVGKWLDDCETVGIGGRVFGIFDGDSSSTINSNGSVSLGVPVFDVFSGTNQTLLVAFDAGAFGRDSGSITVGSDMSFYAAEAFGRFKLAGDSEARADLIGGYTFLRYDNATSLRTVSIDGITNATPDGTVTTTFDSFGAQNSFHGGHIGIMSDIASGFCTVSTLGKISLGNMQSTTNIFGSVVEDVPGPGITTTNSGLFTGPTIAGTQTINRFAFIPELGAKLKLDLTKRTQFMVGYTLIVLPNVVEGSDLVNTVTDFSGIVGVPAPVGGLNSKATTYIQGIDLGLSIKF